MLAGHKMDRAVTHADLVRGVAPQGGARAAVHDGTPCHSVSIRASTRASSTRRLLVAPAVINARVARWLMWRGIPAVALCSRSRAGGVKISLRAPAVRRWGSTDWTISSGRRP